MVKKAIAAYENILYTDIFIWLLIVNGEGNPDGSPSEPPLPYESFNSPKCLKKQLSIDKG